MEGSKTRLEWITLIKGICIILVFLSHCSIFMNLELGYVRNIIEPIYVNAFFFVSGYLFFRKYLKLNVCKSDIWRGGNIFNKIVLPSILFSTISYFSKSIIKGGSIDIQSFVFKTIGGCTYWFTSALFVAQLIFLLLLASKSRNIWLYTIVGIILATLGKIMYEHHVIIFEGASGFPWMYKQGFISAMYFSVGGVYMRYEKIIDKVITPIVSVVLGFFYVVSVVLFYNDLECTTSMCMFDSYGATVSIVGCILLICICKKISSNFVIDFIGNQSLGFYFLSGAIPLLLSLLVTKYIGNINYLSLVIVMVLSITFSWFIVKAILKYCPWTLNFNLLTSKINKYVQAFF